MSKFWTYGEIEQFTFGSSWSGSTLQANSTKQLFSVSAGQSVIRTRLQGQVLLGVSSVTSSSTGSYTQFLAVSRVTFGLYMNKDIDNLPAAPPNSPYDGHWLQHNVLSCKQVFETPSLGGSTKQLALFNFDGGVSESFAQRGPATVNTHLVLTWSFVNNIQPYWALNTSQDLGIMSAWIACHALIDTP